MQLSAAFPARHSPDSPEVGGDGECATESDILLFSAFMSCQIAGEDYHYYLQGQI